MRKIILSSLALGLLVGPATMLQGTVILIDDFDDGNDDGWHYADTTLSEPWGPGIYDPNSGAYLLQGSGPVDPNAPADGLLASAWLPSTDPMFSNGYVRLKVRVNEKNTSAYLGMRTDLGTFSGHLFLINTELENFRFGIQTYENFASKNLIQETGPLYEEDQEWMLEAGAIGDQLSLKYWKVDDPIPVAPQLTTTDILGDPGMLAVGASFPGDHNPASLVSATFDDIVFCIPEPGSLLLLVLGVATGTFTRRY